MTPIECHQHRAYWLARCEDCREARRATLLLPAVQSCTVTGAPRAAEQRIRGPIMPGDARVPPGNRLWRMRRTHP